MINFVLFKRELKANYKLILIFIAILTIYESMIVSMFDPELGKMFAAFRGECAEFRVIGIINQDFG